jgi:hypothetical protein
MLKSPHNMDQKTVTGQFLKLLGTHIAILGLSLLTGWSWAR